MDNFIIGATNKAISENMKFLRDYKANPEAMINAANANVQQNPMQEQMGGMLQFIMLMMLMQMMGGGGNTSDFFDTFPDYRDLVNTNTGGTSTQTDDDQNDDDENPAAVFLQSDTFQNPEEGQSFADILKAELEKETFTRKELRLALTKDALQTDDPEASQRAFDAITELIEAHVLNPLAFMQAGFLNQLSDDQYDQLLQATAKAGLPLNEQGTPQPAFLSYFTGALNASPESLARHFASRLMVLYAIEYGNDESTQGDQVRNLMALTGIYPED